MADGGEEEEEHGLDDDTMGDSAAPAGDDGGHGDHHLFRRWWRLPFRVVVLPLHQKFDGTTRGRLDLPHSRRDDWETDGRRRLTTKQLPEPLGRHCPTRDGILAVRGVLVDGRGNRGGLPLWKRVFPAPTVADRVRVRVGGDLEASRLLCATVEGVQRDDEDDDGDDAGGGGDADRSRFHIVGAILLPRDDTPVAGRRGVAAFVVASVGQSLVRRMPETSGCCCSRTCC